MASSDPARTTEEILLRAGVTRERLGRWLRQLWEDMPLADQEADMAMAEHLFALGWAARERVAAPRPCHCLCVVDHPQRSGICDALSATAEHRLELRDFTLTVRVCQPCADAHRHDQAGARSQ